MMHDLVLTLSCVTNGSEGGTRLATHATFILMNIPPMTRCLDPATLRHKGMSDMGLCRTQLASLASTTAHSLTYMSSPVLGNSLSDKLPPLFSMAHNSCLFRH